jgi:hypothetical protein
MTTMMTWTTRSHPRAAMLLFALLVPGCSSPTGPSGCGAELAGGNCLVFEDEGTLDAHRAGIEAAITDALARVDAAMPISGVTVRVRVNPSGAIPELGIGGYNPSTSEVILSVNPAFASLDASIADELGPTVAHEFHHARRRRAIGYGSTLLQAMVSEGLADHFAMELYGIPAPIWATALDGPTAAEMLARAEAEWNDLYDHATWFFGADPSIPRWTGYSLGFELVSDYLAANPGRRASALFGEPAERFAN